MCSCLQAQINLIEGLHTTFVAVINSPYVYPHTHTTFVAVVNSPYVYPHTHTTFVAVVNSPYVYPHTHTAFVAVVNSSYVYPHTHTTFVAVVNSSYVYHTRILQTFGVVIPFGIQPGLLCVHSTLPMYYNMSATALEMTNE